MDKMDERIQALLAIIDGQFSAIRNDWSDPRGNCRIGWEAVSHMRELLGLTGRQYRCVEGRTVDQFLADMEGE